MSCPKLKSKFFKRSQCRLNNLNPIASSEYEHDYCYDDYRFEECSYYKRYWEQRKNYVQDIKNKMNDRNISNIEKSLIKDKCPYGYYNETEEHISCTVNKENIDIAYNDTFCDPKIYDRFNLNDNQEFNYLYCNNYCKGRRKAIKAVHDYGKCEYLDFFANKCLVSDCDDKVSADYRCKFCDPSMKESQTNKTMCSLYLFARVNNIKRNKSALESKVEGIVEGIKENLDEKVKRFEERKEYFNRKSDSELIGLAKKNIYSGYERAALYKVLEERGIIYKDDEGQWRKS
jgi:hypothetical protein